MTRRIVPYTAAELQDVVDKIEWAESVFLTNDEYNDAAKNIGEIELLRIDTGDEVIGRIVFYDGWIGFVFNGQEAA